MQFLCYTQTLESFTKEQKSCYDNKYGSFATMQDAKLVCLEDSKCIGVYDQHCDGENSFSLCPREHDLESSTSSCTYIKGR